MIKGYEIESNDAQILLRNSQEFSEVMHLIYNNDQNPHRQILHNGHIAVELLIKSFIRKNKVSYPKTHDIETLCQWALTDQNGHSFCLYDRLASAGLLNHYRGIRYAWTMNDRYNSGRTNKQEAIRLYNSFKEVITWIQIQC